MVGRIVVLCHVGPNCGAYKRDNYNHSDTIPPRLMHVTDWIPTLVSAGGGSTGSLRQRGSKLDGIDIWNSFATSQPSPRKEMLYNIDPYNGENKFGNQNRKKNAAIRVGDMKLIVGGKVFGIY